MSNESDALECLLKLYSILSEVVDVNKLERFVISLKECLESRHVTLDFTAKVAAAIFKFCCRLHQG